MLASSYCCNYHKSFLVFSFVAATKDVTNLCESADALEIRSSQYFLVLFGEVTASRQINIYHDHWY